MRSSISQRISQLPLLGCCLLAFTIPFPFQWSAIAIWLLAICWLIGGAYKTTLQRFVTSWTTWVWVVFLGLHAAGYWYSIDREQSLFDTVSKLSFVLMPFLVGAGYRFTLRGMGWIITSFTLGVSIVMGICVWNAWQFWQVDHQTYHFFYHELPRGFDANAVYMAWYVAGALAGMLLFPWREAGLKWMVFARWLLILFLSGVLILLASRLMLLVYTLLIIPAFGLRLFRRYRLWIIVPILAVGIGIAGLYALSRTNNYVHKRFTDIMNPDMSTVLKEEYKSTEPHWTNLTLRLFVWRIALENMEILQLWWKGTGNGDTYIYQDARIAGHGIPFMDEDSPQRSTLYKVNMHNMYLQSLVMFGIPGLLIMLVLAFGPLFYMGKTGLSAWFFALFQLSCILFFIQEAALQTQAGVVYYCFFSGLLSAGVKRGEKPVLSKVSET